MTRRSRVAIDPHHLWEKDGLWFVRYQLPAHQGGKRLTISTGTGDLLRASAIRDQVLGPLLQETDIGNIARRLLAQVQASDGRAQAMVESLGATSGVTLPSGPTLGEASRRFIENRRVFKANSLTTIKDYDCSLALIQKILGNVRMNQITAKDLRSVRDKLMQPGSFRKFAHKTTGSRNPDRSLSPKTVVKYMKNFVTFFNWAIKEELVEKNPAALVDLPKFTRNLTPCPPLELVDALCSIPQPNTSELGKLEWEVLPWIYRYTGARLGEVCRLTVADIVVESGIRCFNMVTLKTKTRKGPIETNPRRLIPVHPRLAPIVDRILAARAGAAPGDSLFPLVGNQMMNPRVCLLFGNGWANKYSQHAKKIWPKMHVHCWRAYAISEMARHGVLAEIRMRVVGHCISSVHDGYTHIDIATLADAVAKIR